MIKPGALIMAVVMSAVAAGTYFGLDMLPRGVIPPPFGRVPLAPVSAATPNPVAVVTPAVATAPAPAPAASAEPAAAPTEQDLAEEPTPKPMTAEPAAASAPPAEVAHVEAAPAAQVAAAPAPQPKADVKPIVDSEPKVAPKAASKPEAPKTPSTTTAEADKLKQWWPDPAKLPATQLKVIYAGDVQGEAAIGLLFSEAPDMESLKVHGHVREITGAEVGGTWAAGKNPKLVVFRGVKPGTRYTVILDLELADVKGFALGQTLQGPVYIPVR